MEAAKFIRTWKNRSGNEIGNAQSFLNDLCQVIGVAPPHNESQANHLEYGFERPVTFHHADGSSSNGRIDLYRRSSFVLEAKQGSAEKANIKDPRQHELITGKQLGTSPKGMAQRNTPAWTAAMLKAKGQAYAYARALEVSEGWPPFLMVADVGHVVDVYADFTGAGKNYAPFPDGVRHRIHIDDLAKEDTRKLLRAIWQDPLSLDPTRKAARVTRQIASELAQLGKSFEAQGHGQEATARFLMRCLFTMFAEDVELIEKGAFTGLLAEMRGHPQHVAPMLESLWASMNDGGFSPVLKRNVLHFNGGLFREAKALAVNNLQLGLLINAAKHDWQDVEPAIFGTLMERALSPKERHKLGAHFTPRAYVERLVGPTILEPLRADWLDVQAAALKLHEDGELNKAIDLIREFKRSLCNIRVLDPACGSGNFLYVALEGMKRLEGEVTESLHGLGDKQVDAFTVDPHQFLGIELNPWAAAVAELVLWIGYLQWHFRTFGKATPSQPVLKDFHNIENRDALLVLKGAKPRVDENGKPVTRWDGESYITSNVTGERVPDAKARVQIVDFESAKPAGWPAADFIVGNPPFIGASRMREALGDGYTEALWAAFPEMPQSADFVMFWWDRAAELTRFGVGRRFGFITTNSLRQTFNRRVVEQHLSVKKKPLYIAFAIPDHPWVDSKDGAAVRIAMTVAALDRRAGRLTTVETETASDEESSGANVTTTERKGRISASLQTGADTTSVERLRANDGLAHMGVKLHGLGFLVTREKAHALGLGTTRGVDQVIRPYLSGRDIAQTSRDYMVIDLFGLPLANAQRDFPRLLQHLVDTVKPERDQNNRATYRDNWWIFGEPRRELRPALAGLHSYIVTTRTAKHRVFSFVSSGTVSESKLVVIASDSAALLCCLSARCHIIWALAQGAMLEDRPNYNHSECFDRYPFPAPQAETARKLTNLGEELDAHRKARQKEHPKLTLTQMYNVLEQLRANETIEGKDKIIYEQGLIGILKNIHDRIDAAVAEAYGWPVDLSDGDILERLVALNKERRLEEAVGKVRWLRPDFQNPSGAADKTTTSEMVLPEDDDAEDGKFAWPSALPVQVSFVRGVLADMGAGTAEDVSQRFLRAPRKQVQAILESLAALGQARTADGKRFAA
ncbi:MAG: class I SAM-dependent DNA methyltransferase [Burkholderiales bacterium]|nr:MAG: class I SAM-dependent DNA methyltransferase [Burkholderiales bacterium]